MHFHDGRIPEEYRRYVGRKVAFLIVLTIMLAAALVVAVSLGAANVPIPAVVKSLVGMETTRQTAVIVWNIRLPQALAAKGCRQHQQVKVGFTGCCIWRKIKHTNRLTGLLQQAKAAAIPQCPGKICRGYLGWRDITPKA